MENVGQMLYRQKFQASQDRKALIFTFGFPIRWTYVQIPMYNITRDVEFKIWRVDLNVPQAENGWKMNAGDLKQETWAER